jgi:hypothetical protein
MAGGANAVAAGASEPCEFSIGAEGGGRRRRRSLRWTQAVVALGQAIRQSVGALNAEPLTLLFGQTTNLCLG